jgi:integrase
MAFTKRDLDQLRYDPHGPQQQIAWDADFDGRGDAVPGFGCRIYPTGKKSFVLAYRTTTGRTRLMAVGKYGVLTLDQARKKARAELAKVTEGADPVADRRAARANVETVKEFAGLWLDRHAKPHRRSWREDKRRIETRIVPTLGHRALTDVRRADIESLHAEIGADAPTEANRVAQLLRAIFTKAIAWGYLPEGASNPAAMDRSGDSGVKQFSERSRRRYVTPAEMPKLLEKINEEPNTYIRAALMLYLLTGLRKNELLRAKWSDIDLEARTWTVAERKGDAHTLPLSEPAAAILRDLPRYQENVHVFPGHKKGAHLVNIAKNWRTVREKAGCVDVTLHDLRRTVGSWMASSGVSLAIVGQVLGHAPGDVQATAIYARLQQASARKALDDHGAALLEVINGKPKVDPLKDRLAKLMADPDADPAEVAATLRAMAEQIEKEG